MNQIQIHHKFLWGADNERTWEYLFYDATGTVYEQASMRSIFAQTNDHLKGVRQGMDLLRRKFGDRTHGFSPEKPPFHSGVGGPYETGTVPRGFSAHQRFDLTEEDHVFLRYWMSRHTLEVLFPSTRLKRVFTTVTSSF